MVRCHHARIWKSRLIPNNTHETTQQLSSFIY